ncbi:MAG: hypothetical protein U9P71_05040 [Campylobacterota bacterium]|nr:hypothetical protein [Campylobacterota bacterium]
MLIDIIKDDGFTSLMGRHIEELLIYLFEQNQNFGVLCKIEHVTFEPELPKDISDEFRPMTLFFLAGYTFESARFEDGYLSFEAGFGTENIGSIVTLPILSILQVIIDETPIFVNLASVKESKQTNQTAKKGVNDSMASFLANPENKKFLKK